MPPVGPGPWLAPLAPLYGAAVLLRRFAYDRGLAAIVRPAVTTVAVGGLEAGGSGKTPVTGLVLRALLAAGRRPGLLTRGYGRPTTALAVRLPGEQASPAELGDEPAMLVASGLDVAVAACGRRSEGATALAGRVDTLVLDDGFQHRALARDLDIVVLRGEAPFGTGHLLPWGTLREPPTSLARAGVVWLHFRREAALEPPAWLARLAPAADLVVSRAEPEGELAALQGARVVAAAGIARPADLGDALTALGAEVTTLHALRDHHVFDAADARALAALVRADGATALVVTPKDAVKLRPLWSAPPPLWVVGTRPRIVRGADALARRLGVPLVAVTSA